MDKLLRWSNIDINRIISGFYMIVLAFVIGIILGNVFFFILLLLPYVILAGFITYFRPDYKKKTDLLNIKDIDDCLIFVQFDRKTPGIDEDFDDDSKIFFNKKDFINILEETLPDGKYFNLKCFVKKLKEKFAIKKLDIDEIE